MPRNVCHQQWSWRKHERRVRKSRIPSGLRSRSSIGQRRWPRRRTPATRWPVRPSDRCSKRRQRSDSKNSSDAKSPRPKSDRVEKRRPGSSWYLEPGRCAALVRRGARDVERNTFHEAMRASGRYAEDGDRGPTDRGLDVVRNISCERRNLDGPCGSRTHDLGIKNSHDGRDCAEVPARTRPSIPWHACRVVCDVPEVVR
jgi:hypothetical protein